MKTISLQQLRATFRRHLYDERSNMTGQREQPVPTAPIDLTGTGRLKSALRRIPIIAPALIGAYQLAKVPSRVALMLLRLDTLLELLGTVSRQNRFAASRIEALEKMVSDAGRDIQSLRGRSDHSEGRQEAMWKSLAESSRMLEALQGRSQDFAHELSTRIAALKPIIHGGENLVVSQVDGFIMAFPAEEWRLATYSILIGQPEPGLYAVMQATLREGMVVVDVGANVGTYTLLALRATGTSGKVISYEPTPRTFGILHGNVQVNAFLESGRIDLRQKAVSDGTSAKNTFFVSKSCLGHSSLYATADVDSAELEAIEVETVSLDADLGGTTRVDVVKIDAEGAEPAILRGMKQIIRSNPRITIFIEFGPQHLVRANVDPRSYLAEIRSQGFEILEVKEPSGDLHKASDEDLCNCFSVNLMLRKSSAP